jgi:hypothetical protein
MSLVNIPERSIATGRTLTMVTPCASTPTACVSMNITLVGGLNLVEIDVSVFVDVVWAVAAGVCTVVVDLAVSLIICMVQTHPLCQV